MEFYHLSFTSLQEAPADNSPFWILFLCVRFRGVQKVCERFYWLTYCQIRSLQQKGKLSQELRACSLRCLQQNPLWEVPYRNTLAPVNIQSRCEEKRVKSLAQRKTRRRVWGFFFFFLKKQTNKTPSKQKRKQDTCVHQYIVFWWWIPDSKGYCNIVAWQQEGGKDWRLSLEGPSRCLLLLLALPVADLVVTAELQVIQYWQQRGRSVELNHADFQVASPSLTQAGDVCISCHLTCSSGWHSGGIHGRF